MPQRYGPADGGAVRFRCFWLLTIDGKWHQSNKLDLYSFNSGRKGEYLKYVCVSHCLGYQLTKKKKRKKETDIHRTLQNVPLLLIA